MHVETTPVFLDLINVYNCSIFPFLSGRGLIPSIVPKQCHPSNTCYCAKSCSTGEGIASNFS